jgi:hypothetical protein
MTVLVALLCACQGGKCFYCRVPFSGPVIKGEAQPDNWTRDHVHPWCDGGRLIVLACYRCNQGKGSKLPTEEQWDRAMRLYVQAAELGKMVCGEGWKMIDEPVRPEKGPALNRPFHWPRWPESKSNPFAEQLQGVVG